MIMHLHPDNLQVTVYIENKKHVHTKRPYFIPTKTKDKVIEMYSDGILPKEIAQYLRDNVEVAISHQVTVPLVPRKRGRPPNKPK